MTERLHFHFPFSCIGEGNGNPLQCSYLENPRDGGACWAAVYGVAQSRTRLKWLSSYFLPILICCFPILQVVAIFQIRVVLSQCVCAQSCLTLCNPLDCSPLSSSVHGILQARLLKWGAIAFSRGSSQLRDQSHNSYISRQILYHWATWEALLSQWNTDKFPTL